ncbi:RNA polymerase sigma factor SigZ [Vibrio sp. Of7-15]|uniref:RNA polymerase sigma factor SigZ n=1 Tax=Vibrio sp. Of7-15 TaxID=2724879 RepID=UPI001EF27D8D|nr:RNA polymerase sigma factor SigZ [Vibrio sp. Of7-15]MCG7497407.1 RNA polymerase sigma factor SigZ [Vibrio sp. Of7-15]
MTIEQIWQEYQTALKAFLHSKISNPDDVDDLLQDVLIKTFNNLSTIKDTQSIKAWLFQVANNGIIDFYRAQGKLPTQESDFNTVFDESESSVQISLAQCIEPFINALPAENAELLRAIDINGKAQKQYALDNGISYSTLKSRVQVSRGKLKGLFEECCHFSLDKHGNIIDFDSKKGQCNHC